MNTSKNGCKITLRQASEINLCYLAMPLSSTAMHLQSSITCSPASRRLRLSTAITTIAFVLLVAMPARAVDDRSVVPPSVSPPLTSPAAPTDPKTAADFNQRGTYRAQNGDLEGAIADFSQAIQLKRDYVGAYYNRGTAYAKTGNVRAALADYTQVILLKPNNAAIRYSRGSLRASIGDRQGAIDDFQQAAALYKQQLNVQWQQKALNQIEQLQQP